VKRFFRRIDWPSAIIWLTILLTGLLLLLRGMAAAFVWIVNL
jgi:hypothetical protein